MSLASIRNLVFKFLPTVTSGSSFTITREAGVIVNKTVGGATAVVLPASVTVASLGKAVGTRMILVVDGKGDAGTNNITVTAAGSDTINGAATYVLSVNYGEVTLTDLGGGAWQAITDSDPSQTVTATQTFTTVNATTENVTTLNVAGITSDTDVAPLAATGSAIGNAAAIAHRITIATGADGTKGVQLPAGSVGQLYEVYNQDSNGSHALNVYPPVNGSVSNGATNAAFSVNGWTLALFRCLDNSGHYAGK